MSKEIGIGSIAQEIHDLLEDCGTGTHGLMNLKRVVDQATQKAKDRPYLVTNEIDLQGQFLNTLLKKGDLDSYSLTNIKQMLEKFVNG